MILRTLLHYCLPPNDYSHSQDLRSLRNSWSPALKLDPENNSLRRMLAEVREREGKCSEAEEWATEALRQNPADARGARALAHIQRSGGRTEEAAELLQRHLVECPGPEDWRLNYELAACLD